MVPSSGHGNIQDQHYGITCYPHLTCHHVRKLRARQLDKYTAAGSHGGALCSVLVLAQAHTGDGSLGYSRTGMLYAQPLFTTTFTVKTERVTFYFCLSITAGRTSTGQDRAGQGKGSFSSDWWRVGGGWGGRLWCTLHDNYDNYNKAFRTSAAAEINITTKISTEWNQHGL